MLLQTNSYIVPPEKRAEHARLMRRFRQVLNKIGCDNFEVYEQVGSNWAAGKSPGRYVQIMRFRDRKHQLAVQNAERSDPAAQELIAEFCELVNYPYQVQQNMFAVGFYNSVLPVAPVRVQPDTAEQLAAAGGITEAAAESPVTPQEEIEAQIDPESTEAELLADEAATRAESESPAEETVEAEITEEDLTAEFEEPTNDEAQGDSESLETELPESTESEIPDELLSNPDEAAAEEPEAGEAFEPEPTASEELASEEAANGEHLAPAAGGDVNVEVEEQVDEQTESDPFNLPAAQGEQSGDEESDLNLSEDDLAEIARELADEPTNEGSPNGRGRGPDPQSRM